MKLTGAQILCESLEKEGVEVIFGFPGGVVLPLYDELPNHPQLRHILVRHEQGSAHAADGYARATEKVGVCLATSGPGATNLVTGIANAYLDSVPMVAITGQVARDVIGKDAFQEIDITGITMPITKHNYMVMNTADIARTVKEAFYLAKTGRPGPVLIDIPKDVLTDKAEFNYPDKIDLPGYKPTYRGNQFQVKKAAKLIEEAQRPIILAGRGVLISGGCDELKELVEKVQLPLVTTLLGIGSLPESHPLCYGMLGMHGTAYANKAVSETDLIIAIGMRFDDRVTGKISSFANKAKVIHIDIDPAEIGKNVKVDVPIVGDVRIVLKLLNQKVESKKHEDWINKIDKWRCDWPLECNNSSDKLIPQYVINKINELTKGEAIIVTGVGQHQMWCAQHYCYDKPNRLISSGGLGTMGFELPAALGAKIGMPDNMVWCIAGDGGFQMTLQELATITQEGAAVKIAIINNGYLGMVRQWQEMFYNKRYVATPLSSPDFVKLAGAYGIPALKVNKKEQVVPAIKRALVESGPFLINFLVEPEENVFPMVAPGSSLEDTMRRKPGKEVA
jgi:acetolactate synthase-1/2/3 large subunit